MTYCLEVYFIVLKCVILPYLWEAVKIGVVEQPTRLQFLIGESPLTVNCPFGSLAYPGGGGYKPGGVRT